MFFVHLYKEVEPAPTSCKLHEGDRQTLFSVAFLVLSVLPETFVAADDRFVRGAS